MPSSLVNKLDKFTKGYIKGRLTAEEFANEGSSILAQGGKFDFAEKFLRSSKFSKKIFGR